MILAYCHTRAWKMINDEIVFTYEFNCSDLKNSTEYSDYVLFNDNIIVHKSITSERKKIIINRNNQKDLTHIEDGDSDILFNHKGIYIMCVEMEDEYGIISLKIDSDFTFDYTVDNFNILEHL